VFAPGVRALRVLAWTLLQLAREPDSAGSGGGGGGGGTDSAGASGAATADGAPGAPSGRDAAAAAAAAARRDIGTSHPGHWHLSRSVCAALAAVARSGAVHHAPAPSGDTGIQLAACAAAAVRAFGCMCIARAARGVQATRFRHAEQDIEACMLGPAAHGALLDSSMVSDAAAGEASFASFAAEPGAARERSASAPLESERRNPAPGYRRARSEVLAMAMLEMEPAWRTIIEGWGQLGARELSGDPPFF
jgi:hypothetical protein